jgi:hypothetical protein
VHGFAVVAVDVEIDEHVRIHELKIRDRAHDGDCLLGLEHARAVMRDRLATREKRERHPRT